MGKYRIVFIDGPYGVGKTSVAKSIKTILSGNGIRIVDADYCYQSFVKKYPHVAAFCGTRPDNNQPFIKEFGNIIDSELKSCEDILLIVMALTDKVSIDGLLKRFCSENYKSAHVVLKSWNLIVARNLMIISLMNLMFLRKSGKR